MEVTTSSHVPFANKDYLVTADSYVTEGRITLFQKIHTECYLFVTHFEYVIQHVHCQCAQQASSLAYFIKQYEQHSLCAQIKGKLKRGRPGSGPVI